MKNKFNPAAVLLILTGILFIAGIFVVEIRTRQQIHVTGQNLETFISQVDTLKDEMDNAQTAFSSAIKEKTDLLNYQKQKASGSQSAVQEHREDSDSSQSGSTSVFSENTSPEDNSFSSEDYDPDAFSDDSIWAE